jgi:hypothetical protein
VWDGVERQWAGFGAEIVERILIQASAFFAYRSEVVKSTVICIPPSRESRRARCDRGTSGKHSIERYLIRDRARTTLRRRVGGALGSIQNSAVNEFQLAEDIIPFLQSLSVTRLLRTEEGKGFLLIDRLEDGFIIFMLAPPLNIGLDLRRYGRRKMLAGVQVFHHCLDAVESADEHRIFIRTFPPEF